jgi:hypothetical protein
MFRTAVFNKGSESNISCAFSLLLKVFLCLCLEVTSNIYLIILFMIYFKAVSTQQHIVFIGRMNNEWWILNDVEGSARGLSVFPVFWRRDHGKPGKTLVGICVASTEIWTQDLSNIREKL